MKDFLFVKGESNQPSFNLAKEEYLLKNKTQNYISIWQNAPAVIVGVNQNALSEINLECADEKGIKLVRRITGGGAVYHDLGNICYTIIAPYEEGVNYFKKFSTPVIEYLKTFGLNCEFSGRNDILLDGKKISGTAQTVYKNRIMHHGTLLFDSDLNVLSSVLKPNALKIKSKGIKSVKSRVTNVKEHLSVDISVNDFYDGLAEFFKKDCEEYVLTDSDILAVNSLKESKYDTYEWNVGYSPKADYQIDLAFSFGIFTFCFNLKDGLIENPEIYGDFFSLKDLTKLKNMLIGTRFNKDDLLKAFSNVSEYILGANAEEIVESILK